MIRTASLGMPRIGKNGELIVAINEFLSGKLEYENIEKIGYKIREENRNAQKNHIDIVPSNDFSLWGDLVLDHICLMGNINSRFYWEGGKVPNSIIASMMQGQQKDKFDVSPLSTNHWFNTNYVYFVPEFDDFVFSYSDNKPILQFLEYKNKNINSRPVILGPLSYFMLGKITIENLSRQEILTEMIHVYKELFINLHRVNVKSIQIDEPFLSCDLDISTQKDYIQIYNLINQILENKIDLHLNAGSGSILNNLDTISKLNAKSVHFSYRNNKENISHIISKLNSNTIISLGIVDSKSILINDITQSIENVAKVVDIVGSERVIIAPDDSLFLCPYSKKNEKNLAKELSSSLSFTTDKLEELSTIRDALNLGYSKVQDKISSNLEILKSSKYLEIVKSKISINDKERNQNTKIISFEEKLSYPVMMIGNFEMQEDSKESKKEDKSGKIRKIIEENIKCQEKLNIDIISSGLPYINKDIFKFYSQSKDSCVELENSFIQKSSTKSTNPYFIFSNNFNLDQKIIDLIIEYESFAISKMKDKSIYKITLPGILSMIFSAFKSNNVNTYEFILNFSESIFEKIIKPLSKQTKTLIIEFQETEIFASDFIFQGNTFYSFNFGIVNKYLEKIKKLLSTLDNVKPILYFSNYNFMIYVEDIFRIEEFAVAFSSSNSNHSILDHFVSYKSESIVGIGAVDACDCRVPSKSEINNSLKKIDTYLDKVGTIIMPDADFTKKSPIDVYKTISNLMFVLKKYKEK